MEGGVDGAAFLAVACDLAVGLERGLREGDGGKGLLL